MIGNLQEHEIIIAEIPFQDGSDSKWRPAYVLRFDNETLQVLKITTKYQQKSDYIKQFYFEIVDWLNAGLREPSWIDTINVIPLNNNVKIRIIGSLTKRDEKRLRDFIANRQL